MDLNYYKLTLPQKILYKLKGFFVGFGKGFVAFFVNIFLSVVAFFKSIGLGFKEFGLNFYYGNALTKASYFVMGAGHITRGQRTRGIIYILVQAFFTVYMLLFGGNYLIMMLENMLTGGNIGRVETSDEVWNPDKGIYEKIPGDNSFHILLYGILTAFVIIFFLILYVSSVKESYNLEQIKIIGGKPLGIKGDINNFLDKKFHITLLTFPLIGLFMFTIVPLVTMIFIAFTNYDKSHEVPEHLFQWVGFENFVDIFTTGSSLGDTFWRVLGWTLIWAVLATFTNYFFGMLLAMLINKKGIKLKKLYRTLFVATIAVPQFVSLLIMSKMLDADGGMITQLMQNVFNIDMNFGLDMDTTRLWIVIVNMWVGVPYSMLMCSGILMNIPEDLYESARIDGASSARRFFKITLPYMLFVTGPYLITQFIGNINNFNVIYLLSGGGPGHLLLYDNGAQSTDLLITWLYKLSLNETRNYKLASVIGIIVFVVSAVFSLIVYNKSSAVKGEDDFQ